MSDLTIYKPHIESGIKTIVSILKKPPVVHCNESELREIIKAAVLKAYMDTGFKYQKEDLTYIVDNLKSEILNNYKEIRLDEVKLAIANGVRKEYGEYIGLGLVSFIIFIKEYLLSEARNQAKIKKAQHDIMLMNEKTEPTLEEQFEIAKGNAETALKYIKASGSVGSYGSIVYDFLSSINLINLTTEEKFELMDKANEMLKDEFIKKKKTTTDRLKRNELEKSINNLLSGKDKNVIIAKSKKIALESFMHSCIMEDIDLSELIESKRGLFINKLKTAA